MENSLVKLKIDSFLLSADLTAICVSPHFWRHLVELAKLADEMACIRIAHLSSNLIHRFVSL